MMLVALLAAMQLPSLVVSPSGPFHSVAAAVRASAPGGTVVIKAGHYREPTITIDRKITLAGEPGAVLDGEGSHEILVLRADGIVITGLEFTNTGFSYHEDRAAVHVAGGHDCTIADNRFTDTFFAIYVAASRGCVISGNDIRGRGDRDEAASGNGIHLWSSREVTVEHNHITGHRDGIYLEFTHAALVRNNLSEQNIRYGMHFMYSDSSSYVGNRFRANGSGVAVMYTRSVSMINDTFEVNRGAASYGLLLKEIQDAHLEGNLFRNNTVGLLADGADRLVAIGNRFDDNGWALRLLASSFDGRFEGNAFRRNSFDVAVNGRGTSAVFARNWWESYHGWDLDHDGFGDVPYHPVRLFALLVERAQPALLLQRSLFVRLLDAAERALPVLTPANVYDSQPLMHDPMGVVR
jgi:nitrous oxidase accessory protein